MVDYASLSRQRWYGGGRGGGGACNDRVMHGVILRDGARRGFTDHEGGARTKREGRKVLGGSHDG